MFSQLSKNIFTDGRRDSATNNIEYSQLTSSGQNGSSLFFSVPTFPIQSEANHQSIALETSTHYNNYENDEEYQSSEPASSFLSGRPIDIFQEEQPAASIYKDVPPLTSTSIIISPNDNPLSENLLTSCLIPPPLSTNISHRKYKDPPTPLKKYAQNSIFFTIRDSTGLFFISIVFSLSMVFLWTYLLHSFAHVFVWVTVKVVPFVGILIFIWTITEAFTGALRDSGIPDPQDDLNDPDRDNIQDITSLALTKTTTISFGTLCFGSFILSIVYTLQAIVKMCNKYLKRHGCFYYFTIFLEFISAILDIFNNYVMIYVGISGEDFLKSSRAATELFKKSFLDENRSVDGNI
nr:7680_t:CDS:2 [Entrophospora candida]